MERRTFLQQASLGAFALSAAGTKEPAAQVSQYALAQARGREIAADAVIAGGRTSGVAAALSAARNPFRVDLTEETD
jgi:hypothetical protein